MKIATPRTKNIFMAAARQGRVMHTLVHFDEHFYEDFKSDGNIQRAYEKIGDLLKAQSPDIPTAYATLLPHALFFELGNNDFHAEDNIDSAVNVPMVQEFIQQRSISAMLISGQSVIECIKATVQSAINQGIAPIVIADATDTIAEPKSDSQDHINEYRRLFETLVDGDVHVAHVEDIQDWMRDLHADDYMHS